MPQDLEPRDPFLSYDTVDSRFPRATGTAEDQELPSALVYQNGGAFPDSARSPDLSLVDTSNMTDVSGTFLNRGNTPTAEEITNLMLQSEGVTADFLSLLPPNSEDPMRVDGLPRRILADSYPAPQVDLSVARSSGYVTTHPATGTQATSSIGSAPVSTSEARGELPVPHQQHASATTCLDSPSTRQDHPNAVPSDGEMDIQSFRDANQSQWAIPQELYQGNSRSAPKDGKFPAMPVDVAAQDALRPESLIEALNHPLVSAFPDPEAKRRSKRFTIRFAFQGRHECNAATQFLEYASGNQDSRFVESARTHSKAPVSVAKAVPLVRIKVVELVARELHKFLSELETAARAPPAQQTGEYPAKRPPPPLQFKGRDVKYEHIQIVSIFRPTAASMQAMLVIRPDCYHFYE